MLMKREDFRLFKTTHKS